MKGIKTMSQQNDTEPSWVVCPSCGAFHRVVQKNELKQPCEMCRRKGQTDWCIRTARLSPKKWWR